MTLRLSSARIRVAAILTGVAILAAACIETAPPVTRSEGPFPVALLVPGGSGEAGDEVLARSLENAARLAIADLGDRVEIDLRVYQTKGNPEWAAFEATNAVNDGARVILGPVFAQAANAVGTTVRERVIPVLSFSNNVDIAGGNVYVLGATFQNTANRLADYATAQGRTRAVVAYADTPAGQLGARAVESAVARSGGQLVARTHYPLSQEDVIAAVSLIRDTIETTGASAIYLTSDAFGELPLLAQLLPEQGIDTEATRFIGLTRWDIPASTLSLPGLQGGWFALPDPALTMLFEDRYVAAYGSGPHPLAGLAYDGIAAIGALVAQGHTEVLTAPVLTQSQGFAGVGGVFRLLPDGTNERALAVAQIQDNQVTVIDPAPKSFGLRGF